MGKVLLFIGLLLGGATTITSQTLVNDYYADAVQIAARVAAGLGESAEISPKMVAELLPALEAVAQHSDDAAQLVTKKLNIHTFAYANTHDVQIYVDAEALWAQELHADKTEIEQTPLRYFTNLYDLELSSTTLADGIVVISLHSEKDQNMRFIANEISFAEDVMMVELPAPVGGGNDIKAKRVGRNWVISYIYKYQDCKTGCKKQCEWQFGVSQDLTVEFLGAYGEMPSLESGCISMVVMKNQAE